MGEIMAHKQRSVSEERPKDRKSLTQWWCGWCIRYPRAKGNSGWEQQNSKGKWLPLCKRCANRRLINPYNALLAMRRVKVTDLQLNSPEAGASVTSKAQTPAPQKKAKEDI